MCNDACICKKVEITKQYLSKKEIEEIAKFLRDYPNNDLYTLEFVKYGVSRPEVSIATPYNGKLDAVTRNITDYDTV
jgi:hypothetical protein